jgi:hypothetical protein
VKPCVVCCHEPGDQRVAYAPAVDGVVWDLREFLICRSCISCATKSEIASACRSAYIAELEAEILSIN